MGKSRKNRESPKKQIGTDEPDQETPRLKTPCLAALDFALFSGNSYGPMALKVRQTFSPRLVLVHGWLFPGCPQSMSVPTLWGRYCISVLTCLFIVYPGFKTFISCHRTPGPRKVSEGVSEGVFEGVLKGPRTVSQPNNPSKSVPGSGGPVGGNESLDTG